MDTIEFNTFDTSGLLTPRNKLGRHRQNYKKMQVSTLVAMILQVFAIATAAPINLVTGSETSVPASQLIPRSTPESYIVIFENGTNTPDSVVTDLEASMKSLGITINYVYHSVIKGFSISLQPELIASLKALENASYPFILEQDKKVQTA